jgi:pyruvate dehydrogenase E1 component alpha subunit
MPDLEPQTIPDLLMLYRWMLYSRRFEEAVTILWREGEISGEMHLAIGEEGIAAGINAHLKEGDALALDHRGTPPMLMRGVDPVLLLKEFLGHEDGLSHGMGGHMHLFSRQHLAASSGIVGASGPTAAGFALAARHLRPGNIAVAYFGDGAMNQGILLESFNLAVAWKLPVLFVCKDDEWAITTLSAEVTGGSIPERARGFGLPVYEMDGWDVAAVWRTAGETITAIRDGKGPVFLHARCRQFEGHYLGFELLEAARHPLKGAGKMVGSLTRSLTRREGAGIRERAGSLKEVTARVAKTANDQRQTDRDPVQLTRRKLEVEKDTLAALEAETATEIQRIVEESLASRPTLTSEKTR